MSIDVLFVDDEEDMCEVLMEAFVSDEVAVTTFTVPAMAVEWAKSNKPDLIFLDYVFPGTNGDEIALQLNNKVPTYLVTGMLNPKTKFPFVKIFEKPLNENEIREVIAKHSKREGP